MNRMRLPEKALVVALDHARTLGVVKGLEDPGTVLDHVIEAGADGIMTSLMAGGSKMDTEKAALEVVHGAMLGGAKSVVFGRNIWQSRNVPGAVAALRAIIHSGVTYDQALELVGS